MLPYAVKQLLQVKKDSDTVLEHEERILDMVLQVQRAVKSRVMALGIQEKVSTLQLPYKLTVYHMLYGLTYTTSEMGL